MTTSGSGVRRGASALVRRTACVTAGVLLAAGVPAAALAAAPVGVARGGGIGTGTASSAEARGTSPAATGRYIVTVRRRGDLTDVERTARAVGGRTSSRYSAVLTGLAVELDEASAARLDRRDGVTVVRDAVYRTSTVQHDASWGLDRLDQRLLPLDRAFTYERTGRGVTAYVVDSGVRSDHVELEGRVERGFDAVRGQDTRDCNGHGTHVAGTLAGRTTGVAKAVTVVPVRVFDCAGAGRLSDVLEGLDFVARDHAPGQPAVVNLSLGGSRNSVLDAAVQALTDDGVTVVAAAGNSGTSACRESPAAVASAITVAATGPTDRVPDWSNGGSCVDLFAPGAGVRSAWHSSTTATAVLSGTSMAAPHVAGAAALVLEAEPAAAPEQVWARLRAAATLGAVVAPAPATPNRLLSVLVMPAKARARPGDALRHAAATG